MTHILFLKLVTRASTGSRHEKTLHSNTFLIFTGKKQRGAKKSASLSLPYLSRCISSVSAVEDFVHLKQENAT